MKTTDKIRKTIYLDSKHIVHIIGNILMVIGFVLAFIYQNERTYSFYWLGLGMALLGSVYYCDQYSKEGKTQIRRLDNKWDKNLSRKSSDKMLYVLIIGVLSVMVIFFLEFFYEEITRNMLSVSISLVLMLIYQAILIYIAKATEKQVIQVEKDIIKSNLKN